MARSKASQKPVEVVEAFVERINRGDLDGMIELLTDDHVFVDALGEGVRGSESMRAAWAGYLECFPDYEINVQQVLDAGERVGVFGMASGTYALGRTDDDAPGAGMSPGEPDQSRSWHIPAAWLAVVRGGRIAEWHVYCDTQAMVSSMMSDFDLDETGESEIEFEI